jgi:hypothetical protein
MKRVTILTVFLSMATSLASHPVWSQEASAASKLPDIVEQTVASCEELAAAGSSDFSVLSNDIVHVSPDGSIELLFHAMEPTGPEEEADLRFLGARIVTVLKPPKFPGFPQAGAIQAWVPCSAVADAATLLWVVAVTTPGYGTPNSDIESEGVVLHRADIAQQQGVDGTGVKVGAISNGVDSLADAQAASELPAVTVLDAGSGDEGTGMLELINDMAPGASLYFHAGGGVALHVNALQDMLDAGVNVIAEDLAFDTQPAFQQGMVATAREATAAAGTAVHSSAGNRGNDHAARVPAVGTGGGPDGVNFGATPPGCSYTPDNVVAIAPGGDTTFDVTLGQAGNGSTSIVLQWSEPRAIFPTAGQGGFTDLNLYVMDAGLTQCLAESVGIQADGVGDTIETISIDSPGTAAKIVVDVEDTSSAVAPPTLDLRWRGMQAETDATTRAGSNDPDKNYTGQAFVIGAVGVPGGGLAGFSSAGPVDLELTTVCPGGGAGPCDGVAGPAAQHYQGMDFLGANGTSISGAGGFGSGTCPTDTQGQCLFFGTSAAAPHTAACDALVRQLLGANAAPATIRARLAATAVDYDPPGEDSTTGAGLVDCFAALGPPDARCQDVEVPTDPGVCYASSASVDDGSSDPFGQAITLDQSPAAPYSLGDTAVTLTATDTDGLYQSCDAVVTVLDEEDPVITAPSDRVAECSSHDGTPVDLGDAVASDNCDVSPEIDNDAPALFPLGMTTVTWTATDDAGNTDTDTQEVTVVDTTPPELELSVSQTALWPPNHKLVTIEPEVMASDICDPAPVVTLVSITSNEPANGLGDGNTDDDIVIIDDFHFKLRAERSGHGEGREYTITYQAEDASGNKTTAQVVVSVGHNE